MALSTQPGKITRLPQIDTEVNREDTFMHSTHGFSVSRRTILLPPQNQIFSSPSEFSLAPRSDQDPRADRDYRRLGGADSGVEAVFGEEPH